MLKNSKGFTAVELVVTVSIIAVTAAIATPSMITLMYQSRLKGASRQIMSDMMWARMAAVTQRNEFRIIFVDDHVYKILDDDDNDGKEDKSEWTVTKDIRENYDGVNILSTVNPIFFPRGSASMGTVTVKNAIGEKKVKVHITGRVKIG